MCDAGGGTVVSWRLLLFMYNCVELTMMHRMSLPTQSTPEALFDSVRLFPLLVGSALSTNYLILTVITGENCGSVYVNQAMERHFTALLANNESLERKRISAKEQLLHSILPDFEGGLKRVFDTSKGLSGSESFIVHGLEADESKNFGKNRVKIGW